jgi:hypothetical protein
MSRYTQQLANMAAIKDAERITNAKNQLYGFTESVDPYSDAGERAGLASLGIETRDPRLTFSFTRADWNKSAQNGGKRRNRRNKRNTKRYINKKRRVSRKRR